MSNSTAGSFTRIGGGLTCDYFITDEGVFRVRTTSYLLLIVLIVLIEAGFLLLFGTISTGGVIGVLLVLVPYSWLTKRKTRKLSLEGLRTLSGGGVTRFGWNEIQNRKVEKNNLKFEYTGKRYSLRLKKTQQQSLERVLNSLNITGG